MAVFYTQKPQTYPLKVVVSRETKLSFISHETLVVATLGNVPQSMLFCLCRRRAITGK